MSDTKPQKSKLRRSQDPNYTLNPDTGRYIKKAGKAHTKLLSDGVAGIKRNTTYAGSIVASGTLDELRVIKKGLEQANALNLKDERLEIRNGHLMRVRKSLTRREIANHTTKHAVDTAISNRGLFKSKLTDEQLSELLRRMCDAKIMGVELNLEREFDKMCALNERSTLQSPRPDIITPHNTPEHLPDNIPSSPPKLVRTKKRRPPQRTSGLKFRITAPPSEFDTTTAGETTCYSDTEISD